jgi:hypothetical protein
MVVFNNQTVSKIEGAANALMQRLLDGRSLLNVCFMRRRSCNYSGRFLDGYSARQAEKDRL